MALGHFEDPRVGLVGPGSSATSENAPWIEKTWKVHLARSACKETTSWLISRVLAIKKDVFLKVGGFNESLKTCEDVELSYRVKKAYKIISDDRLPYLHLGEEATLKEFFIKEAWRGSSSVEVSLKNLNEPKEVLSLTILFYYLVLIFVFLPLSIGALIMSKKAVYLAWTASGMIAPIAAITFDTCKRTGKFSYFGKLFIMYAVYIFARVAAIFR
jgi:GT2 family glycosyltransferase